MVQAFRAEFAPQKQPLRLRHKLTEHFPLKALSVLIALSAWLVALDFRAQTATRTLQVPILVEDIPEDWRVDALRPAEVRVTLTGPQSQLEDTDSSDIVVAIDASHLDAGPQQISLGVRDVQVPSGLTVNGVSPSFVRFNADPTVERSLRTELTTSGQLPEGYVIEAVHIEPPTSRWIIPARLVDSVRAIPAAPISLSPLTESAAFSRALLPPAQVELAPGEPKNVTIRIDVATKPTPSTEGAGGAPGFDDEASAAGSEVSAAGESPSDDESDDAP